jgi:flagellar assembly factor FliW
MTAMVQREMETTVTQLDARLETTTELEREISFLRPIIGFPNSRRFVLGGMGPRYAPYLLLSSLDEASLRFIVVAPGLIFSDYVVEIPEADAAMLALDDAITAEVLTLVTHRSGSVPTLNLLGPIVINWGTGDAAQIVLGDSNYGAAVPVEARTARCEA